MLLEAVRCEIGSLMTLQNSYVMHAGLHFAPANLHFANFLN